MEIEEALQTEMLETEETSETEEKLESEETSETEEKLETQHGNRNWKLDILMQALKDTEQDVDNDNESDDSPEFLETSQKEKFLFLQPPMEDEETEGIQDEQTAPEDSRNKKKRKELSQGEKVMFTANTHMLNQKELREKIKYQLKRSTDPVERIRLTALLRGPGGIRDIGRIFKNMDEDNSGQISFLEFQQGVAEIGCVLDHYELQQAYEAIDTDNSGSISYQEFLVELRDKVMNRMRERMVRDAFSKLDKDGSGCLTMDDLRGVCDVSKHVKIISGEWTEEQALEHFLCAFYSFYFLKLNSE